MYHAIVRSAVRKTWQRINAGDYEAAVSMAAPDMRFHFVGDTRLGAEVRGADAFRAWFAKFAEYFPDLRLSLVGVVANGWPWDTTIAVRLRVRGTLDDGTPYDNIALQWAKLRWGRLVDDIVVEDTLKLNDALQRQERLRLQKTGPTAE